MLFIVVLFTDTLYKCLTELNLFVTEVNKYHGHLKLLLSTNNMGLLVVACASCELHKLGVGARCHSH